MTKIKNTKKGMAKKTLSVSLAVAMLATSNVPVWAAEFSDGSEAVFTVEAPAVESTTTDVATEAFSDESTPEVVAEETATPAAVAEVNTDKYTSDFTVTMNNAGWGSPVTVTGTLKDKNGVVVKTSSTSVTGNERITANYTWLANGRQADGDGATGDVPSNTEVKVASGSIVNYTPTQNDFNKELSLMVTVKRGNTVIYQETVVGGVVGAKDISNELNAALTGINDSYVYDGKEQKPVPSNVYNAADGKIKNQHITWNYATEGNDFTNYTNKDITVTGTLEGTYDANSDAYGYKGHTASKIYKITKKAVTVSDLVATMKTLSVQFTGSVQKFGKSDVTLGVKIDDDTTIDITDAIKSDAVITGKSGNIAVTDNGYELEIPVSVINTDSKVVNNFDFTGISSGVANTTNKYKIVARNLSKCTGEVKTDIKLDTVKDLNDTGLKNYINGLADSIELKGDDGKTFTLENISNYVTVTVESALTNAIKNKTTGVVNNAIKIAYITDEKSVTGSILLPVRLTTQSLSDATISVNGITLATTVDDAKTDAKDLGLIYDGKAKKLEDMNGFTLGGVTGIQSGEYEISYDDNINAGIVKVTLTGKKSYEGSVKNFYFKISPATISADNNVSVKDGVAINTANDADASLYKDAVALKIEKALVTGDTTKTKLEEGKDYTVKYYYTSADKSRVVNNKTTADAVKNDGSNVVGGYVTVVVNITKGNYSSDGSQYFAKSVPITAKSIEGVTITLEKATYTFTGEKIVPDVVVKDGSSVLEKGVDYSLQVKDNRNVGTATVTVKALAGSDYKENSTATTTFTITPAKAEDVKVTLSSNGTKAEAVDGKTNTFKYNKGKQVQPAVSEADGTITLNGVDVTSEFDVKRLTYGDNNQAGKEMGTVTISPKTGNKNFDGTKTQKFNIQGTTLGGTLKVYGANKKAIAVDTRTKTILEATYHFYYNGKDCTFADAELVPSIVAAKESTDYEIKYVNNVDAGLGFAVAVAKGNYEGHAADSTNITWTDVNGNNYVLSDGKLTKNGTTLATNVIDAIAFVG